jgi:hypothetical protein
MLASDDFWDDLLGYLKDRVLIPVVGPELVTVPDGARRVRLTRLLAERFAARYQLNVNWDEQSDLPDALNVYIAGRGDTQRLYRVVNDLLSGINPPVPDALRQLADIRDCRLFISTTFDSLLAQAVNDVRFNGQPRVRDLWFSPNQSTPEQQDNARVPGDDEAVVFRLFGRAASTPVYAVHDEDVLEWLHTLLTETARLPDWLAYRLKDSPILFLGCPLSDWVGRLLTRMTSNQRLSLVSKQFFIVSESISRYPGLTTFFQTFSGGTRIQIVEADPAAFVAELHERWRARNPQPISWAGADVEPTIPPVVKGSIFISYAREDARAAGRLSEAVSAIGGDVWIDQRRLEPGGPWEAEILASIRREIRLFLPVISKQTEARDEGFVFREWDEAVERARSMPPGGRKFIIPVAIDADYDGNPSRYRHVPESFRAAHWGSAPGGTPNESLVASLKGAIRDARRKEIA